MTEEDKMKISGVFFTWVIKDPYPEHSAYQAVTQMIKEDRGLLGKVFGCLHAALPEPPEPVSIHKAWRDGYDFAKKLVMDELKKQT